VTDDAFNIPELTIKE
jgi:methylphosphotriester-DNA--protein-cysteine methyltransferase